MFEDHLKSFRNTTSTSSIPIAHKIGSVYSYIAAGSENVLNLLNGWPKLCFFTSQLAGPPEMICFDISVEFFALKLLGSLFIRSAKTDHTLVINVESIKLKIREIFFSYVKFFFS